MAEARWEYVVVVIGSQGQREWFAPVGSWRIAQSYVEQLCKERGWGVAGSEVTRENVVRLTVTGEKPGVVWVKRSPKGG